MTILSKDPDQIDDETLCVIALALHLEINCKELEPSYHDARCIEWGNQEWWVFTDEEADNRARDHVESYIADCIIPGLPPARAYFDERSFMEDCMDEGRGLQIATYDGEEHEVYIQATDEWLYLYRTN